MRVCRRHFQGSREGYSTETAAAPKLGENIGQQAQWWQCLLEQRHETVYIPQSLFRDAQVTATLSRGPFPSIFSCLALRRSDRP
mmetsp:Transcript_125006/g.176427  ORF Transcript_125006/g.176427 Transcript_125006/m.176427 type:complete len:84 (+) Transcript_125006:285-536(+)